MSEKPIRNEAVEQAGAASPHDVEQEIDLLELFYKLIENLKYIVAAALAGALVMAGYSFFVATPMYEATSKLYVMSSNDSAINLSDLQIGSYLTKDYQEVFNTWEVHELVISNLGLPYTYEQMQNMLTISNPSDTRMLYITVKSDDPAEAMNIANEYAKVASEYIKDTMATEKPNVLSDALMPSKPVSPKKATNLILGFMVGLLIAVAIIVVRFIMDDKLKNADDIRKYIDLPTLAVIPVLAGVEEATADSGKKRRHK